MALGIDCGDPVEFPKSTQVLEEGLHLSKFREAVKLAWTIWRNAVSECGKRTWVFLSGSLQLVVWIGLEGVPSPFGSYWNWVQLPKQQIQNQQSRITIVFPRRKQTIGFSLVFVWNLGDPPLSSPNQSLNTNDLLVAQMDFLLYKQTQCLTHANWINTPPPVKRCGA